MKLEDWKSSDPFDDGINLPGQKLTRPILTRIDRQLEILDRSRPVCPGFEHIIDAALLDLRGVGLTLARYLIDLAKKFIRDAILPAISTELRRHGLGLSQTFSQNRVAADAHA